MTPYAFKKSIVGCRYSKKTDFWNEGFESPTSTVNDMSLVDSQCLTDDILDFEVGVIRNVCKNENVLFKRDVHVGMSGNF